MVVRSTLPAPAVAPIDGPPAIPAQVTVAVPDLLAEFRILEQRLAFTALEPGVSQYLVFSFGGLSFDEVGDQPPGTMVKPQPRIDQLVLEAGAVVGNDRQVVRFEHAVGFVAH